MCFRVTTIYPVQDQTALQDRRVMSLIQYAKKVEKSMFEVARSRVSVCVCVCVCVLPCTLRCCNMLHSGELFSGVIIVPSL